ncbi:MAG TPA: MFS transporter [Pseudonocardia sp.]|jgi:metabolite-proton symporter|uniref:MFS transporter n=1 Tax=Pseudonocardia sp. TaxID=60912 RepID=UPI002B4B1E25|nr:MFS transporter [Pseudonocardia sp.]HLU58074.1 MFS transporter [Pseudonocardia sp.]
MAENAPTPRPEDRRDAVKAVVAGTVGTAIEWYDFYIYGLVAGLVFNELFFPEFDPLAGTLLAFSTFFVGFLARPLGAAIFGHLGDRIGRKASLVATLTLMALGTVLVGVVPTYDSIGVWGAVLLVVLRVVQSIGVGGEWSGSVLLATEWTTFRNRRGFTGSWAQWGSPAGLTLATATLSLVSGMGQEQLLAWGWRIPFLASFILFGVGLWIRLGILETPFFQQMVAGEQRTSRPVVVAVRRNWREIILTCLVRMGQHASFYLFTTFALSYGVANLGLPQQPFLNVILVAGIVSLVTTPLFGWLSDVIGRRRMYLIGIVTMLLFAVPYFAVLESGSFALIAVFVVLSLVVHDMQYGPQAALIAEAFPANVRYSGSALGYQLSSITSAGPAPIVATYLAAQFGSSVPAGVYLVALCLVALAATLLLRPQGRMVEDEPVPAGVGG